MAIRRRIAQLREGKSDHAASETEVNKHNAWDKGTAKGNSFVEEALLKVRPPRGPC